MADRTDVVTRPVATEIPAVPPVRRTSWGAIFAGTIIAMMLQLHFAILGLAIGLSTVNPTREANPTAGLGVGATIWWVITAMISLFIGGWVAGRLAGVPRKLESALHGFGVWALAMLLTAFLLTTAVGAVLGGGLSVLQTGAVAATQPGSPVAGQSPDALRDAARNATDDVRDTLSGRVNPRTAERATNIGAAAAWGIVVMQLLGLIAALIGGVVGTPRKSYAVQQTGVVTTAGS